ncbi:uncharacterized protein LOC141613613 [Silene latifolia]|uniref:uncharacterized protein LOC141613613 n=1 Tax=Silene latifolia TaxID=37657 RepID=UPI003D772F94
MNIDEELITKKSSVLEGFSGETKSTLGEIHLPTYVEGVSSFEKFGVLYCLSSYNAILGMPWINNVKAVLSTYHQCIKVPVDWGIATIKGEHKAAQECYTTALKPSKAGKSLAYQLPYPIRSTYVAPSRMKTDQKRRKFALERNAIINEEVEKLLDMGMIRETMYSEWLANVMP